MEDAMSARDEELQELPHPERVKRAINWRIDQLVQAAQARGDSGMHLNALGPTIRAQAALFNPAQLWKLVNDYDAAQAGRSRAEEAAARARAPAATPTLSL
jgi:hypothetical protein